jgi:hypothetical protein
VSDSVERRSETDIYIYIYIYIYCIRCGPDEERILDVVPREDGARNSG